MFCKSLSSVVVFFFFSSVENNHVTFSYPNQFKLSANNEQHWTS